MTPPDVDRPRAERFARLPEDGHESGEDHPQFAESQFPDGEARLAALGRRLATIEAPGQVDPEFRTNLRAMLVAAAERAATERTTALPAPAPVGAGPRLSAALAKARVLLGSSPDSQRARTRRAIIAAVAVGAFAVSGISTASESSVPGDALYGMKRSTERAQLALAVTDVSRAELLLEFARVRLGEAAEVRGDSAAFARLLAETDHETTGGVALLTGAATETAQAAPLDTVGRFVARQRPALTQLLEGASSDTERVRSSLDLLDSITTRIEELRATLRCGPHAAGPTDALGPLPAGCTAGTGPTDAPRERRTAGRVTASAGDEAAPTVSAETAGAVPPPMATATPPAGATTSEPEKSKDPQPRPSRSHP